MRFNQLKLDIFKYPLFQFLKINNKIQFTLKAKEYFLLMNEFLVTIN